MSARPAHRIAPPPWPSAPVQSRQQALERRRRERHFARRRRDFLEDLVAALALTIFAISVTAGLAVIALFAAPLTLLLIVSYVLDRRARRRGGRRARGDPTLARIRNRL